MPKLASRANISKARITQIKGTPLKSNIGYSEELRSFKIPESRRTKKF
jgi:hypothetical protein